MSLDSTTPSAPSTSYRTDEVSDAHLQFADLRVQTERLQAETHRSFYEEQRQIERSERRRQLQERTEAIVDTPTRASVAGRRLMLLLFLKANGFAGVHSRVRSGLTWQSPLHAAARQNEYEVVLALLERKACPIQRNSWRRTPLEIAEEANKHGSHADVIDTLRAWGAQMDPDSAKARARSATRSPR